MYLRFRICYETKLNYSTKVPQTPLDFIGVKRVAKEIEKKDCLISLPYESINPFLNLLRQSAVDPQVVSIKMTLYRLAKNSKVVEALVEAAENGKQVDVLVELKARFDEENNIGWSRRLEDAGCHVIYGIDNLKVHSKLCLITRKSKKALSILLKSVQVTTMKKLPDYIPIYRLSHLTVKSVWKQIKCSQHYHLVKL